MSISQQTLITLEFPKILARLAQYTAFSASRELALALSPSTDVAEVRHRLRRTGEARLLLDEYPETSIGGTRDVRDAMQRAQRGGVLDAAVFLEIESTLANCRRMATFLRKLDPTQFALLQEESYMLPSLPALEQAITSTIGDDGTVLDSASSQLARLRSEIRTAFNRLQDRLQNLITSSQYSDALQESIITVRQGRYVVPIKASHRRNVRGLVHDQSSSGATLYVEPMAVVELNNRWRELQSAEEEEVARILGALSVQVGDEAPQIMAGVDTMASLDLAFAMAKYAIALRCVEPIISEEGVDVKPPLQAPLQLTQARHPLLEQETVVPTDIWLGTEFRWLLITGPNTGGKTVALKTAGLLALMAQTGLHIPARAPSGLPVFAHIFADIGDEQSIEQSLSTFSSHMSNIIRILGALDEAQVQWQTDWEIGPQSTVPPPALVLLDELGAGTDPVEGAALARVIVHKMLELNVLGIATSHYAELKAFAYNTEGVENGSVEFDVETLAPTYRLTIGLPGRSNALAIASRLGLDAELVERARSTMAREDAQVEDLLAGIHREREAAAAELARVEALRVDAEKYRDRLSSEWQEFEQQREQEWQAARQQIDDDFREARHQLRRLRDDFRSVSLTRQWLEEAEQRAQHIRTSVPEAAPVASRQIAPPPSTTPEVEQPRPLRVGDTVRVRSVGLSGEIIAIDEEEQSAEVQVGGFRVTAELRELRREKRENTKSEAHRSVSSRAAIPPPPDVSMSFDIRGWRASEVPNRLDRYLNDAYLAGLPLIRVIHGKGTGALRQIVRDMFTRHPLIRSFEGGGPDGGEGVTVAYLNEQ
ncbi:MAG: endonuclease MutS2 [Chloroflexi bacterium AL-W]|nr:endonuclease MutS2 [Chloroflexi bacterium AL-N1]NOK68546.1 endonuclease MutS2 [Chloroflexi bacterium AL-N10]NOK76032.1 endonuclease MutS2 [Chloroflexi bacterium AL-N5]NOK82503.1 endonuclease MutS2 [Chloroflexi bacterium AL-W]NOK92815.1 endonuclease MutS2 [Chloroflexi bacterium AL-N15]